MKIGIVGLGFVGLSLTSVLSSKGYNVIGIDVDKEKCKKISHGISPFFEPELEDLLKKGLKNKLKISSDFKLIRDCDFIFVTVGTPQNENGSIDLSIIKKAISTIGENLQNNKKKQVLLGVTGSGKTFTMANIVEKIQQYTTIDNFLTRERNVIQSSAGLQFSDPSFNSSKSGQSSDDDADKIISKIKEIIKNISRDDVSRFSSLVKRDGSNKKFVENNKLSMNNQTIRTYLTNFFSSIHSDADRLGRRLNTLKKMKF